MPKMVITVAAGGAVGSAPRAFMVVGVLGGFTTFSAFAMDTVYPAERGQLPAAGRYMASSVVVSLAALLVGMMALRAILA